MDKIPNEKPNQATSQVGVTEIFVTRVHADKMAMFREWLRELHQLESTFPGFQKVYVQVPEKNHDENWVTLLQFDSEKHLQNWLNSSERKIMLAKSDAFIRSQETHRLLSSFEGWFPTINAAEPPVWKQTMLILLALFPAVMLGSLYILPLLSHLNIVAAKFIQLLITVCVIAWPIMPFTVYMLGWWLTTTSKSKNVLGVIIVIILYLIEVGIFYFIR